MTNLSPDQTTRLSIVHAVVALPEPAPREVFDVVQLSDYIERGYQDPGVPTPGEQPAADGQVWCKSCQKFHKVPAKGSLLDKIVSQIASDLEGGPDGGR